MLKFRNFAEAKVDEVLDRPGAMKSYKAKAKMQSDRARNSAHSPNVIKPHPTHIK